MVSALSGVAIERGVIQFLKGRPLETLLATFGVRLILQQLVRTVISPQNRTVVTPEWMSGSLVVNDAQSLTLNRMYVLGFALVVFAALILVMRRTRLGLEVRAVTQNRAMGICATRVDIITGKTQPTQGSVWFGSRHNLLTMNEPEIASLGIGRKFQKPTVFETLSVFHNLKLAMAADKRILPTLTARMTGEIRDRIEEVLETIGLTALRHQPAEDNAYHIALGLCMETLHQFLMEKSEHTKKTHVVVECRGKQEDKELELEFRRICDGNNRLNQALPFEILFADKKVMSSGLQLADLVAPPIGLITLKPDQPNRTFDTLKYKFYCEGGRKCTGESYEGYGMQIFPSPKSEKPR